jgi:lysophospholipase
MAFVRVPGNPEPEYAEELFFEGRGGVRLRAMIAQPHAVAPRGTVLLCPGRTEFIEKYFEVITELQSRGFVVLCLDWRGQGLSDRETSDRLKGHIASLDDAVADLFAATRVFGARLPRPHIVMAHSMGGGIALRGLQANKITADAAFFTAPMWGIRNLKDLAVQASRFLTSIGFGEAFAFGVETRWRREPFKKNSVTNDKERFARAQGLIQTEPNLALAGPTFAWVAAAAEMIEAVRQPGALAHLRLPVSVLSAGEELLVENAAHEQLARAMPNARHVTIARAKHELLMETDDIRAQVWAEFDALVARLPTSASAPAAASAPSSATRG